MSPAVKVPEAAGLSEGISSSGKGASGSRESWRDAEPGHRGSLLACPGPGGLGSAAGVVRGLSDDGGKSEAGGGRGGIGGGGC